MASSRKIVVFNKKTIKKQLPTKKTIAAKKSLCTVPSEEKTHSAQSADSKEDKSKPPRTRLGKVRYVSVVKNVTTGSFFAELEYFDVNSELKRCVLPRSILESTAKLRNELLDGGAQLSEDAVLEELKRASPPTREVTHHTGIHGDDVFVLPKRTYGSPQRHLRYEAEGQNTSRRGERGGTLKGWRSGIRAGLRASSYLAFGAGTTFAAPLVSMIGVEETAAFHVYGESAAGKTLMEKACESIMGPATEKDLITLNRTPRALNDQMAAHDGTILLLNELKNADGGLNKFLLTLSHVLTSGTGVDRSNYAKRVNRELQQKRWTVTAITTMEHSLERIMNGRRDMGERVRHIDLPVPRRERGGIFDRTGLRPMSKVRQRAKALALEVAETIEANYGVAFETYIEYVLNNRQEVAARFVTLVANFVDDVAGSGGPWDHRLARKFGYSYAGAIIAIDAGVLLLDRKTCRKMCCRLYRRARGVFQHPDEQSKKVIGQLQEASRDGTCFPIISAGQAAPADFDQRHGFRRKDASGLTLAVKGSVFREWCNSPQVTKIVTDRLAAVGALEPGQSGVATRPIQIEGAGRHRYYVIKVDRLKAA